MSKISRCLLFMAAVLLLALLAGCNGSSSSGTTSTDDTNGGGTSESLYVGSDSCQECHPGEYDSFMASGHPYKLNKVENGEVPTYPFSNLDPNNDGGLLPNPEDGIFNNAGGEPTSYADITYVIGGYGWKARWIGSEGYIVTSDRNQYNLADGSWSDYNPDVENKPYNCGNCHTTGWKHYDEELNPNRQDGLAGMDGTFAEGGIGCEACHGGGAKHVESKNAADITRVATARTTEQLSADDQGHGLAVACGECHTRDGEKDYPSYVSAANEAGYTGDQGGRIVSNGAIGKHHQQYDELLGLDIDQADGSLVDAASGGSTLGKHYNAGVGCTTCHNPHTTTKYQDDPNNNSAPGVSTDCTECHGPNGNNPVAMPSDSDMANLDCKECHMPKLAKSAIWTGTNKAGKKLGDISSHIFKIDLSKSEQLTDDSKFVNPWITADYACGSCHASSGFDDDFLANYTFHQESKWEPQATNDFAGGDYVGSAMCGACHQELYADFMESGHPFKLNKVENGAVPTYPFSDLDPNNDGGLLPNPEDGIFNNAGGEPTSYADITYVIGGYGWKARWIGSQGYIVTSDRNQYNLADGSWSDYNPDVVNKPYNCGNCHTTGWKRTTDGVVDDNRNNNRQDSLAGMDGTFAEAGIGCESCHGGGSAHASAPSPDNITKVAAGRSTADFLADDMAYGRAVACGECHTRDGEKDYPSYVSAAHDAGYDGDHGGRIVSNGTIGKHHQQYDELLGLAINNDGSLVDADSGGKPLGYHLQFGVDCNSCHNPHTTTKYQDDPDNVAAPGVSTNCTDCHVAVDFTVELHANYDCIDCHMPKMAKSAIWTGTNAAGADLGDISSHIFKIDLSETEQLTVDKDFVKPWITPDYACGECHATPADKVNSLNNNYGGQMHP